MRRHTLLTIATLLSVLFVLLHLADDIVRGIEKGGLWNLSAVLTMVTWLFGALVLTGRRSGLVITLLGSLLGVVIPLAHFKSAAGVAGHGIAQSSGALLFVWTLLALGVSALFGLILSAHGLWRSFASRGSS